MDRGPDGSTTQLSWQNIGFAFGFIFFDAVVSKVFGLGVGTTLVISAVRCVVQLSVVALILQQVFEANNPWAVTAIACECSFSDLYRLAHVLNIIFFQSY